MKKYFSAILFLLIAMGCSKPEDFYDSLEKGAYLTLVSSSTFLNATDPNAKINIVVNAVGSEVASVNIYTSAANTLDKSQWKLIKNVPFAGNTTLEVSNGEIASALGLPPGNLAPGSVFNLYNEVVTKDGKIYSSINTSSQDLENQIAFNAALRWTGTVVCPYNPATIAGTYTVVRDDWADWQPGDLVEVTAGPGANEFNISQVWPNPAFGNIVTPLIVTVDPATGVTTIPDNITFGDYGGFKGVTSTGNSGFVFSCNDKISLNIHVLAPPFGDQGFLQLILEK
jgi:hypothetical protein